MCGNCDAANTSDHCFNNVAPVNGKIQIEVISKSKNDEILQAVEVDTEV